MTKLFLIRHGETTWNEAQRFQGQIDVPLNRRGWDQAQYLAERFADESIDAIYASDLHRALDTAQVIAQRVNKPVIIERRLREACLGELQGKRYAEVHARWFRGIATTPCYFVDDAPLGVESLRELQARLMQAVQDIVARHRHEQVLIVTHGACLRAMFCAWLGMELATYWKLSFDSGSVSAADLNDETARVVLLNDTIHLNAQGVQTIEVSHG